MARRIRSQDQLQGRLGLEGAADAPPATEKTMGKFKLNPKLAKIAQQMILPDPERYLFEFSRRPWAEELAALCKLLSEHPPLLGQIQSLMREMDMSIELTWWQWDLAVSTRSPRHGEGNRSIEVGNWVWYINPGEVRLERQSRNTVQWNNVEGFL